MPVGLPRLKEIDDLSIRKRVLRGAAWNAIGALASVTTTMVAMVFIARILGQEAYGMVVMIQSTVNMVGVVAGFGIGTTATRYVATLRNGDVERLKRILVLAERSVFGSGLVVALGLMLSAEALATRLLDAPGLGVPLSVAALAVVFSALDGYQKSVMLGLEAMKALAIGTIVASLLSFPAMLLLTSWFGVVGTGGAIALGSCIQWAVSGIQMRKMLRQARIPTRVINASKEWRVLRDFALPALLAGLFVMPAHWVCHALLANSRGGFAELALLGVAMQWFNVITFVPSISSRVVLPVLTERLAAGDLGHAHMVLKVAVMANLVLAAPIALFIVLKSTWIAGLYGAAFRTGGPVLVVAALTSMVLVGLMPVGQLIAARDRMWLGAVMNLGWAIAYVLGGYLLLDLGALGIATAMAIAYSLHFLWTASYASLHLRHR